MQVCCINGEMSWIYPDWPKSFEINYVLVSLVFEAGDSVLCWPEGLGFDLRAGWSMWYGVVPDHSLTR